MEWAEVDGGRAGLKSNDKVEIRKRINGGERF